MADKISSYRLRNAINYANGKYATMCPSDKKIGSRNVDEFLKASKEKRVLDMGCGLATWSIVAALYGAATVDAFDLQPEMVDFAKAETAKNGVSRCVKLQVSDVSNMNYPSQSKDRLISVYVACTLPTDDDMYSKHFQEMSRVMAYDGEALVVAPISMNILFTSEGTDVLEVRDKIEKTVKGLGCNPSTEAIIDAFDALPEVYTATFANDENGKLFLVTDVTKLKEGQPIWRKLPKFSVRNYYHSDGSYEEEFQRAGLKITRIARECLASEKERKEYNERMKENVGPESINHAYAAFYYVRKQ